MALIIRIKLISITQLLLVAVVMAFTLSLAAQANSLSFEFNNINFPNDINQLKLEGGAFLQANILHLTKEDARGNPEPNTASRASFHRPITLWAARNNKTAHFTSEFIFTLEPTDPFKFGDGLSFFLAPFDSRLPPHSDGGALGLVDLNNSNSNRFVAVEFDRFINKGDPPSGAHIGIDVNSIVSAKTLNWDLANGAEVAARAVVSYNPYKKELNLVVTDPAGLQEYARLSYDIDLRHFLPESVRVGFSASTGEVVERHNIQFWKFTSILTDS